MLRNLRLGNITGICSLHRFSHRECKFGNTSENFSFTACLPIYSPAFFPVPFLTQFEICDLCRDAFVKCSLFMRFSPHVFINVQLLYSKITPAQNLLSLNEEEEL